MDKNDTQVGTGLVGAPACGDVMKLQIKVDENGKIIDAKFKTFGCGSAIASSSLATEWVKGKTVSCFLYNIQFINTIFKRKRYILREIYKREIYIEILREIYIEIMDSFLSLFFFK